MKEILLIAFLILSLLACEKSNIEISELVAVDSLGWDEEADYYFANGSFFKANDDYLYVCSENTIKMFDLKTFELKKVIGRKGKAPGEFLGLVGMCISEDALFVSDPGNKRVQKLSLNGDYQSLTKVSMWNIYNFSGEIYGYWPLYSKAPFVLKYDGNKFVEIQNGKDLYDYSENKMLVDFFVFNNKKFFIAAEKSNSTIYEVVDDKRLVKSKINEYLTKNKFDNINAFFVKDDKLYFSLLKNHKNWDYSYNYKNTLDLKTTFGIEEYLVTIDSNLKVIKEEKIPDNIYANRSLYVTDDEVIVMNLFGHVIYKLKRD